MLVKVLKYYKVISKIVKVVIKLVTIVPIVMEGIKPIINKAIVEINEVLSEE